MSVDKTNLDVTDKQSTSEAGENELCKKKCGQKYSHDCGYVIAVDSDRGCFSKSKWFDGTAESTILSRPFTSTSNTYSQNEKSWICTRCRLPTTDEKHSLVRINKITFYACDTCRKQIRLQRLLGMIFRQIQIHLGFTTLWIPSPDGSFLGDRSRNYGEWVAIIVLLVVTLLFEIASFVNVMFVRPISLLKQKQRKRPLLDFWLELHCAFGWIVIVAIMVHDGIHQYGQKTWDGRLIGLLSCACLMLLSYLFTSVVAWRNVVITEVTTNEGSPEPFGQRKKVNVSQAIANLS